MVSPTNTTHCHLFIAELADVVQILTKSAMVELHGEAVKALLSTASSDCLCLTNPPITTAQRLEPAFVSLMNQQQAAVELAAAIRPVSMRSSHVADNVASSNS